MFTNFETNVNDREVNTMSVVAVGNDLINV